MNLQKISSLPAEAGIAERIPLDGCPFCSAPLQDGPLHKEKLRVNIMALGDVGTTMLIGLHLLGADVIRSIGIYDLAPDNLQRLEQELNQVRYPFGPPLPPVEPIGEEKLFDGDVVLFCASKGVPPVGAEGDVRMAQLQANRSLMERFGAQADAAGYRGFVGVISDPVDPLCAVLLDASHLSPWQIQGYGLGVMHARAAYYAERDPQFGRYLTEGRAFGPHGQNLVLADSLTQYDDTLSRKLTDLAVNSNREVRALGYKPYIAPSLSSAALSLLLSFRGEWHYGSVYLGNAQTGAYFGVKNRFTPNGIEFEDPALPAPLYDRVRTAYLGLCRLREEGKTGKGDGPSC